MHGSCCKALPGSPKACIAKSLEMGRASEASAEHNQQHGRHSRRCTEYATLETFLGAQCTGQMMYGKIGRQSGAEHGSQGVGSVGEDTSVLGNAVDEKL